MTAIRTENLAKDYRMGFWRKKVRVLQDLNLEIHEGEVFGYLGPNGAGKTTTLKILMGLVHPTAGEAQLLGRPISEVDVKKDIGFLPEGPYFYEYLTGRELLDFYARLFNLSPNIRSERVRELLALVNLEKAADLQLRKYSKGMLQRIGLAQTLINDPKLVILDEPMSGLDPVGRREVRDLILKLKGQGKTIFFSTHIIPDVEVICDRVGIIVGGRLAAVGPLEKLVGGEVESIEIVASGISEAHLTAVRSLTIRPPEWKGERVTVAVRDDAATQEMIHALSGAGARIHSVIPKKRDLEEFFLSEIGRDEKDRGHCS